MERNDENKLKYYKTFATKTNKYYKTLRMFLQPCNQNKKVARLTFADRRKVIAISVKIKISYEQPEELALVLRRLGPVVKSVRTAKVTDGRFKRAYVFLIGNDQRGNNTNEA